MTNMCLFQYSQEQFSELKNKIDFLKRENEDLTKKINFINDLKEQVKNLKAEYASMKIKVTTTLTNIIKKIREDHCEVIVNFNNLENIGKQRLELVPIDPSRNILSIFTPSERKSYLKYKRTLQKLFDLEYELEIIFKENEEIENNKIIFMKEKITPLLDKLTNSEDEYNDFIKALIINNDNMTILKTDWINQLIIQVCLPYAIRNNIYINGISGKDEDDYEDDNEDDGVDEYEYEYEDEGEYEDKDEYEGEYEDEDEDDVIVGYEELLDKCIIHYANSMSYHGIMSPLCANEECDGIYIGNTCNCGMNKNIWFTTKKPDSGNFIEIKDTFFVPEANRQLGYLVERDSSIDEYIEYADKNDLTYDNFDELFIKCNNHHYNILCKNFYIPHAEFPQTSLFRSYVQHTFMCVFCPEDGTSRCKCRRQQLVYNYYIFNPRNHSIKVQRPAGYLQDIY